jgi:hypothetical protein
MQVNSLAAGRNVGRVHDEPRRAKAGCVRREPVSGRLGHWAPGAKREWRRTNKRIAEDRLFCSRVSSI